MTSGDALSPEECPHAFRSWTCENAGIRGKRGGCPNRGEARKAWVSGHMGTMTSKRKTQRSSMTAAERDWPVAKCACQNRRMGHGSERVRVGSFHAPANGASVVPISPSSIGMNI